MREDQPGESVTREETGDRETRGGGDGERRRKRERKFFSIKI